MVTIYYLSEIIHARQHFIFYFLYCQAVEVSVMPHLFTPVPHWVVSTQRQSFVLGSQSLEAFQASFSQTARCYHSVVKILPSVFFALLLWCKLPRLERIHVDSDVIDPELFSFTWMRTCLYVAALIKALSCVNACGVWLTFIQLRLHSDECPTWLPWQ